MNDIHKNIHKSDDSGAKPMRLHIHAFAKQNCWGTVDKTEPNIQIYIEYCDALRYFVSFVQFKKREKHP